MEPYHCRQHPHPAQSATRPDQRPPAGDFAPTIFAKGRHPASAKYGFVNTKAIIDAMRDNSFEIVEVRQSQRRDPAAWAHQALLKSGLPALVGKGAPRGCHPRSSPQLARPFSGSTCTPNLFRRLCGQSPISDGASVEPIRCRTPSAVENVVDRSLESSAAPTAYSGCARTCGRQLSDRPPSFARNALEFRRPAHMAPRRCWCPPQEDEPERSVASPTACRKTCCAAATDADRTAARS